MKSPFNTPDGYHMGNHGLKRETFDRWRTDAEMRVPFGHAAGGVTEKPLNFAERHAPCEEHRSAGVAKVVEANPVQAGRLADAAPVATRDRPRAERKSPFTEHLRNFFRNPDRPPATPLETGYIKNIFPYGMQEMEFGGSRPGSKKHSQEEVPWTSSDPADLEEFADLVLRQIDRAASDALHWSPFREPVGPESSLVPPPDGHVHRVTEDSYLGVDGRCRTSNCKAESDVPVDSRELNLAEKVAAEMLYQAVRSLTPPGGRPWTCKLQPVEIRSEQFPERPGTLAFYVEVLSLC